MAVKGTSLRPLPLDLLPPFFAHDSLNHEVHEKVHPRFNSADSRAKKAASSTRSEIVTYHRDVFESQRYAKTKIARHFVAEQPEYHSKQYQRQDHPKASQVFEYQYDGNNHDRAYRVFLQDFHIYPNVLPWLR